MADARDYVDSPADENNLFSDKGARSLPTKHYPSSGKLAEGHNKEVVEGPGCDNKKLFGK